MKADSDRSAVLLLHFITVAMLIGLLIQLPKLLPDLQGTEINLWVPAEDSKYTLSSDGSICTRYISNFVGLRTITSVVCVLPDGQIHRKGGLNMDETHKTMYYQPVEDSLMIMYRRVYAR